MSANLRLLFGFLYCLLLLSFPGFAQQTDARPKKILTPEQLEFQQHVKQYEATREDLQAQANRAFDSEIAREKAGDCPSAKSTYEFNVCYGKETGTSNQNLTDFEEGIRNLLALEYPDFPAKSATRMPGSTSPQTASDQEPAEFDHHEQAWHSYLDAACTAAHHQFGGGTGGPSFEMECRIHLIRSHMHDLDFIYFMRLHK